MPRLLTTLPLIALMALSQGAMAQDTQAADAATDTPKQEGLGDNLSLGEEDGPKIIEPYVKAEHGDWKLQCFPVEEGTEPCQLYQLLQDDQGTDVAEVAIFRLPADGKAVAGATITVPLETLLTAQLTIAVDSGKGKRYPFSFCTPVGCIARIGFTAEDIAAFKKGAKAEVSLVPAPAPDQTVKLDMSLKGFTDGYNAATVIEN